MKWKCLMVHFNCKTVNICFAKSSVGAVMCHCVIHSLWLGLFYRQCLGQPLTLVLTQWERLPGDALLNSKLHSPVKEQEARSEKELAPRLRGA